MLKNKRYIIMFVVFLITFTMMGGYAQASITTRLQPEFSVVANPETYEYYATTPDGVITVQIWNESHKLGKKYYYTLDGTDPIPGISTEITTEERIFVTKPGKTILNVVEVNSEGQQSYVVTREFNLLPGATFVQETADMNITGISVSGKKIAFVSATGENQQTQMLYLFDTETKSLQKIAEYSAEWISMKYVGNNLVYCVYVPGKNNYRGTSTIYCYNVTSQRISKLSNTLEPKALLNLSDRQVIFRNSTGVFSIDLNNYKAQLLLKGQYYDVMLWNQYIVWSIQSNDGKVSIYVKNQKTGKVTTVPLNRNDYQNSMYDFKDGILVYSSDGYADAAKRKPTNTAYLYDVQTQKTKMIKEGTINDVNIIGRKIYFSDTGLGIGTVYDIDSDQFNVITPRVDEGPYGSENLVAWTRDTSKNTPHLTTDEIHYGLFYKDPASPPLPDLTAPVIRIMPEELQSYKYKEPQWVSISTNEEAQIMYRLNSGEWMEYKQPFYVDRTTVVEAYATDKLGNKSPIDYYEYNFSSNYIPPITVTINNKKLVLDAPPVLQNGRVLVPVRAIFESLGATVTWDETTRTIGASKPGTEITLQVASKAAYKDGQPVDIDVAPTIVRGRTLVPIRFVSEAFGCDVQWDAVKRSVTITTDNN